MTFHIGQKITPKRPDTDWEQASDICMAISGDPQFKSIYTVAKVYETPIAKRCMVQLAELPARCLCGEEGGWEANKFAPIVDQSMRLLKSILTKVKGRRSRVVEPM